MFGYITWQKAQVPQRGAGGVEISDRKVKELTGTNNERERSG
jgi:hypothetical protein